MKSAQKEAGITIDDKASDDLSQHHAVVNLTKMFPVSHRSVFFRSWRMLLAVGSCLGVILLAGALINQAQTSIFSARTHQIVMYYLFWFSVLALALRFAYEEVHNALHYYGIESDHLVVSSGVLLKRRSSIHLSLITDVYLQRDIPELIFLLYTLRVANPSAETRPFNLVRGLARRQAVGLQDYLTNLVKESKPVTNIAPL